MGFEARQGAPKGKSFIGSWRPPGVVIVPLLGSFLARSGWPTATVSFSENRPISFVFSSLQISSSSFYRSVRSSASDPGREPPYREEGSGGWISVPIGRTKRSQIAMGVGNPWIRSGTAAARNAVQGSPAQLPGSRAAAVRISTKTCVHVAQPDRGNQGDGHAQVS